MLTTTSRRRRAERATRRRVFERLEGRRLMVGDVGHLWPDTDVDGDVSPVDALVVINYLNTQGWGPWDPFAANPPGSTPRWLDANFDGYVSPVDALVVINYLNARGPGPWPPVDGTGSLYVTEGNTPVRLQYLLGGQLSETVLRLSLRAENEAIDTTYLGLNIEGSAGQSVDRFELYLEEAAVPFAVATRGAARPGDVFGTVMPSRQLVVPEGAVVDVIVRARIKADTNGGISGEAIAVSLGNVTARGDVSGNDLRDNDGDPVDEGEVFLGIDTPGSNIPVVGIEHIVTMSRIDSVTDANPDVHGTGVPVGLSGLGQFKFMAGAHTNSHNGLNVTALETLRFVFVASNIAFDPHGFGLYNKADATIVVTDYLLSYLGDDAWRITFSGLADSLVETSVSSGSSATLVLRGDITNPLVDPSQEARAQVFADLDDIDWLDQDGGGSATFHGLRLPESLVGSTLYRN